MAAGSAHENMTARHVIGLVFKTLKPERSFYGLAIVYGIGIALLTLATPIAVQVLINTVAYTGLAAPLVVLTLTLFGLLMIAGLLNALRVHLLEIFGRRFYARVVSEISLRAIYAQNPFFADDNRLPLFNRYFDILTIQKNVPVLFIGGFTVILQVIVGLFLVSFYHPYFLAFNLVVLTLIYLTWQIWGPSAVKTAVGLSIRKHETAAWMHELGASNGYYKSAEHVAYALERTDKLTGNYVEQHKKHFRRFFSQIVSFYTIYALASAALLGLGGWLVIQGQLTLGQLVAAELVLSTAFYGVAQLGTYLVYFYDLCASCEELSLFENVEEEAPHGHELPQRASNALVFEGVRGSGRSGPILLDIEIPSGAVLQAASSGYGVQRLFTKLLKRFEEPMGGILTLGGDDVTATEMHMLRREVMVLDRPSLAVMTVRQYLSLARPDVTSKEMLDAMRAAGLENAIEELEHGLDTSMAATGYPLSFSEAMALKLASAILARPRVLILNQLYDTMPAATLQRAIAALKKDDDPTIIVFSSKGTDLHLHGYLYLEPGRQRLFERYDSYARAVGEREARPDGITLLPAD